MWYAVENPHTPDELRHGPFISKEDAEEWVQAETWGDFADVEVILY